MHTLSICISERGKSVRGCAGANALCRFLNDEGRSIEVKLNGGDIGRSMPPTNDGWIYGRDLSALTIMAYVLPFETIEIKCDNESLLCRFEEVLEDHLFDVS